MEYKDGWDKFRIVVYACGVLAVILSSTIVSCSLKQKEREAKMIALAVNVLTDEASEESYDLRIWAIDVINEYAKIKLTEKAKDYMKHNKINVDGALIDPGKGGVIIRDFEKTEQAPSDFLKLEKNN